MYNKSCDTIKVIDKMIYNNCGSVTLAFRINNVDHIYLIIINTPLIPLD